MADDIWVVCLCADWCHVCRGMEADFRGMQVRIPGLRWVWLDIEAHDSLVEDLDINTFPTYLVATAKDVLLLAPGPTSVEALTHFVSPFQRKAVLPMAPDAALAPLLAFVRRLPAGTGV